MAVGAEAFQVGAINIGVEENGRGEGEMVQGMDGVAAGQEGPGNFRLEGAADAPVIIAVLIGYPR